MNRNSDYNFSQAPLITSIQRSRFARNSEHKTTLDASYLYPLEFYEVLPGDSVKMNLSAVIRMSTPIFPVMDTAFFDYYWFFVPNRLIWSHWKQFMGENTETFWTQPTEYQVPQITIPDGGFAEGSLADYLGVPTKVGAGQKISHLPFRAFSLIWNEWFRDQNVNYPLNLNIGDADTAGSNAKDNQTTDVQLGGCLPKVAKPHDYWTSALPDAQKGNPVSVSFGNTAPVVSGLQHSFNTVSNGGYVQIAPNDELRYSTFGSDVNYTNHLGEDLTGKHTLLLEDGRFTSGSGSSTSGVSSDVLAPANLYADLSNASSVTINQLRQAFAVQRLLERDALGGTRYREILRSHFSVSSPDARMMIPEYLGGNRVYINMSPVVQTSSTDTTSPQGNVAAYSHTSFGNDGHFTKSFVEHGILMCVGCIRTNHTMQQSLEKFWTRKSKLDFYWPALANLGASAVKNREVVFTDDAKQNDEVFGYQEAWADYRYKNSRVSSAMRSNSATPLDSWHYADYFSAVPALNADFIAETKVNIDRTIAVTSEVSNQFIADFYFQGTWTRPMPLYSVPGLIDHY